MAYADFTDAEVNGKHEWRIYVWKGLLNHFYWLTVIRNKISIMSILNQIAEYLYLRKPDPNRPKTQWMKYMHGINRISIFLFLFALMIILLRLVILPLFRN